MTEFTKGKWDFCETPIHLGKGKFRSVFFLVGSHERAIGFIRHKDDARLIAAASEMYELLKVWVNVQAQPTLREAQKMAQELLARIDGEVTEHEVN